MGNRMTTIVSNCMSIAVPLLLIMILPALVALWLLLGPPLFYLLFLPIASVHACWSPPPRLVSSKYPKEPHMVSPETIPWEERFRFRVFRSPSYMVAMICASLQSLGRRLQGTPPGVYSLDDSTFSAQFSESLLGRCVVVATSLNLFVTLTNNS